MTNYSRRQTLQLGCLGTVAERAPKNLTIVVWDNGLYQITGGQPTVSAAAVDLVAAARACGLADSAWAADEAEFDRLLDKALGGGPKTGPCLIAARIDGEPGVGATERDPVRIRAAFMAGLGVRR
jgi:thiamine pyrophosphate-dependent acetolactate synthase large subunit-like protein